MNKTSLIIISRGRVLLNQFRFRQRQPVTLLATTRMLKFPHP